MPKHSKKTSKKHKQETTLPEEQVIDSYKKKVIRSVIYTIVNFGELHPSQTQDSRRALIQSNNILKENLIQLFDNIKENWHYLHDKDKEHFHKLMKKLVKTDNPVALYDSILEKNYIDELKKFTKIIQKKKKKIATSAIEQQHKPQQEINVIYALKRMFDEKKKYTPQQKEKKIQQALETPVAKPQQVSKQFLQTFMEKSFFEMKNSLKLANDAIFNYNNYLKTENVQLSDELKLYLISLTNVWNPTIKKNYEKIDKFNWDDDETKIIIKLLYYCAFVILDRIVKVILMINTKKKQEEFLKMTNKENLIQQLDQILKSIKFPTKEQHDIKPFRFLKLRQNLLKKSSLQRKEDVVLPTQQQVKNWQQRYEAFLQQLKKEEQQSKPSAIPTQASSLLQPLPSKPIEQQQKKTLSLSKKEQYKIDYSYPPSPYTHKNDHRFTPQQNKKLEQRKLFNKYNIQQSLSIQSIPEQIMRQAMENNYTCIILIDAANQKDKLSMPLKKLIPMEVPFSFRSKPLFVLVEQGNLDPSGLAKIVLRMGDPIYLQVSCAKERQDKTITDCFKKQSANDFTKNPMDDFVLLTLQHALRSIYYKNNQRNVSKLKILQDLLAENPFSLLQTQGDDDVAVLFQPIIKTYYNILHDTMPYTWSVTDDKFRDWKKQSIKLKQEESI